MVSIVIPCYNGASYIKETLDAILLQQGVAFEVIVVDDGSTDKTGELVKSYVDSRIYYYHQQNRGVSSARNVGLQLAQGEFIIFFDADDKMPYGFLQSRLQVLTDDLAIDFSCGPVVTFPTAGAKVYGVSDNIAEVLLTYNPHYSSCPSNYLFRKAVLLNNNIRFEESLSSTADRFFLLEVAKYAKGKLIADVELLYRTGTASMSSKVTRKLIADNEHFLFKLLQSDLIPLGLKSEFLFRIYWILGLGFIRTGAFIRGVKYLVQALYINPSRFFGKFYRATRLQ